MKYGLIMPFLHNTPIFRSAVRALADFPGPIVLVEHKDLSNNGLEEILAQSNITLLKNTGKSGADDALELGINHFASLDFLFYCHSDLIVSSGFFQEVIPIIESRTEISQWNFWHTHHYFRNLEALQTLQTEDMNYEQLKNFCATFGIKNHQSKTCSHKLEFSKDFWGSHRSGRTSPITGFYVQDVLKVLYEKPLSTWALLDVALSIYISLQSRWKIYYNTKLEALHISASGHDGFGADTGTIARTTSAFIEQDNDIFRNHYGFMPDDYLNFEYGEIIKGHQDELTEAANNGNLTDYNYLLEMIQEKFHASS